MFAGRSVYTALFESPPSPHTMAKLGARERHGMLGLLLQLGCVPIVTFVIPKSPEQGPRLKHVMTGAALLEMPDFALTWA